jgi:hypothetical protein
VLLLRRRFNKFTEKRSVADFKIFFVGEHTTIFDEIETMEAAVESGDRIANLV